MSEDQFIQHLQAVHAQMAALHKYIIGISEIDNFCDKRGIKEASVMKRT